MQIDWEKIKGGLPAGAGDFVEDLRKAHNESPENGSLTVDRAVNEKIESIRKRFQALKNEVQP